MSSELIAVDLIRDIPDFPKEGIIFKDITPVLQHPEAFSQIIEHMAEYASKNEPDIIVGIESRGFVLGAPVALRLGKGFVPIRKLGKLPYECVQAEYTLEYGTSAVEMHRDAIQPGQKVLIIDDLLATGGTAAASARLVREIGGTVTGLLFLIELGFLNGRAQLGDYDIESFITY